MIGFHSWRANLEPWAVSAPGAWIPVVGTNANFTGTGGNDNITGTSSADTIDVSQGGVDQVDGAGGNDLIYFGRTLSGSDRIDGGGGDDTVQIQGDNTLTGGYTVLFTQNSLDSVEKLILNGASGFTLYTIALANANVLAGDTLTVEVNGPGFSQDIFLDADFETDGHINFTGGNGADSVLMGPNVQTADKFNGGGNANFLRLHGDYSAGLVFNATTVLNFFEISVQAGFDYELTLHDATCGSGKALHINASDLAAGESLVLDASAETDGRLFVEGGAGDDTIIIGSPTSQLPQMDLSNGGNDTATGGAGTDLFVMGGALTAADRINGGTGAGFDDTVDLNGNYSAGVVFTATTMVNIERIQLHFLNSYKLTLVDANVAAGASLLVDGSSLGASHVLTFNDAAETSAILRIIGGAGNDIITTGGGADEISLYQGGNDTATGGGGADFFDMGAALTSADKVDGGAALDVLRLAGDYSAGLTFGATTMVNVETILLAAANSYKLTLNEATVAAGVVLTVNGTALNSTRTFTFNGTAEHDGTFNLLGGAGADVLTAGQLNDTINGGGGNDIVNGAGGNDTIIAGAGNDTVAGAAGNDTFVFDGNLTAADAVDGNSGTDTVSLNGDYVLVFGAATMVSVETMTLATGHNYNLTFDNANVIANGRLTVDASAVDVAHAVVLNGLAETDGKFTFTGGAGADTLKGGAQADILSGGAGTDTIEGGGGVDTIKGGAAADTLTGGASGDIFGYDAVNESTGPNYDTLIGFDANSDRIDLTIAVGGIDAEITAGKLSANKFNNQMQRIVQAADLAANHALLVTPDDGNLAGQVFLVVDMNGVAGYQNNQDLVLHLDSAANLAGLGIGDFI